MKKIILIFTILFITISMNNEAAYADKKLPTPEEQLQAYGINLTIPDLKKALHHTQPVIRENAAIILGKRKEKSAIPDLKGLLKDNYIYARIAAAEALFIMGDESGIPVLFEILKAANIPARLRAASTLADIGKVEGYETITHILKDNDPMDRLNAVRILPRFLRFKEPNIKVVSDLIKVLQQDKDARVRSAAADELKNFSGNEIVEAFKKALEEDKDDVVHGIAEQYLKKIKDSGTK
jgi:HEAT repeat protein